MTTIRKIVTSKIEGGDADSNDTNEIRPFGETAFYLDDNNRLILMMFDGVRTHQKSKVLAPGVVYGSNADSGDGLGYDTIKLIPDATLYATGNSDQYIIVDPTSPAHIHLRAGGTIDNSGADLFLGGELTHVKVSDGFDNVVIRTSIVGEGITAYDWTFDNSGSLTLPVGGDIKDSEGVSVLGSGDTGNITFAGNTISSSDNDINIVISSGIPTGTFNVNSPGGWNGEGNSLRLETTGGSGIGLTVDVGYDGGYANTVTIANPGSGYTNGDALTAVGESTVTFNITVPDNIWNFGSAGSIIFPGGARIETAYAGSTRLLVEGGDQYVDIRSSTGILVGSNSTGTIAIGNSGSGVTEIVSDKVVFINQAVPASSLGAPGDRIGCVAFDGTYMYYCTQDYVGISTNVTTLASTGSFVWVSSTDYAGDLVSDFTANSTGWTYNGVTIVSVVVDDQFGPGYLLEAVTSFGTFNDTDYALVSPTTTNIWKRVAWSGDTW